MLGRDRSRARQRAAGRRPTASRPRRPPASSRTFPAARGCRWPGRSSCARGRRWRRRAPRPSVSTALLACGEGRRDLGRVFDDVVDDLRRSGRCPGTSLRTHPVRRRRRDRASRGTTARTAPRPSARAVVVDRRAPRRSTPRRAMPPAAPAPRARHRRSPWPARMPASRLGPRGSRRPGRRAIPTPPVRRRSRADCRSRCRLGTPGPRGASASITSARPPNAPTGSPPPMTLPRHVRSGRTPSRPWAPPRATRKPVITSSKISSAPTRSHSARRPSRKPGRGGTRSHVRGDRLDDHARRLVVELGDCVVRRHDRVRHLRVGDTSATRQSESGDPTAPSHEQRVGVPVIVAGELHQLAPSGEAAGQSDRAHRRLGAAAHQAHLLDRTDSIDDRLGQLHFALRRRSVRRAVGGGRLHRVDHRGVGVTQRDRPVRLHQVDVAPTFDIPDVGTLGLGDEIGRAPDRTERAHRRVHTTGDDVTGAGEQRGVGGIRVGRHWSSSSATSRLR